MKERPPESWIVDPELESVQIYRRDKGRFVRAVELSAEAGDSLTTPLLPKFAAPLAGVFAPLA